MKEKQLGPRQWAFVVVAGGAVLSLPFAARNPTPKPETVVDVESTLLPESGLAVSSLPATGATAAVTNPSTPDANASAVPAALPNWPGVPHSPFEDLVKQKATIPEAEPTEEIVPMHPLRPWITAPNVGQNRVDPNDKIALPSTAPNATSIVQAIGVASPWDHPVHASQDDRAKVDAAGLASNSGGSVAHQIGHGRKQLPVTAGPADQYSVEEIAAKLNLPEPERARESAVADALLPLPRPNGNPELALPTDSSQLNTTALASAILPAGSTLPPATAIRAPMPPVRSSVVLSRQPISKPVGAQVRFGAAQAGQPEEVDAGAGQTEGSQPGGSQPGMTPLPKLPPHRRHHVIFQPQ